MFVNVASVVLFTIAEMKMVIANILEGSQLEHQCSGTLLIVDVETNEIIHKIKNTSMDIIILNLGGDKKVDVTQIGNCCHHVFSDWKCRGEVTTILDNVKHRMKHRGHMSVIKSDMANGSCRSIRDIKHTGVCKINSRYDKNKKQIPDYDDSDESLTNTLEINNSKTTKGTAPNNNESDNANLSPIDSNDTATPGSEVNDISKNIDSGIVDNEEPKVNHVTTENIDNELASVTSPDDDNKQIPEYGDSDGSLINILERNNSKATKDTAPNNNKGGIANLSPIDSNDTAVPDTEVIDINKNIGSGIVDNEEPEVNDVTTENIDNDLVNVTSPVQSENNTHSSLTAICAPFIIIIILVNIFGILCKRNNIQTCIRSNINLKNDWSTVNNDDFATDMDDSDSRSIIRNKKVIYKGNAEYELATSNDL